jgi:peptidoglycan-associated lipoprotein
MSAPRLPRPSRLHILAALGVCAAAGIHCGGAKPPEARAAANPATAPSATTQQARATPPPPPSTVSISDEIRQRCGIPDADAYFSFDSSTLTSHDRSPLDLVVKCFTTGPLAGRSVKLVGRADPRGGSDYNLTLGQARADAVGVYLDGRGMSRSKTLTTSRGSMDAMGSNEAGWQHDRRVDVLLGN